MATIEVGGRWRPTPTLRTFCESDSFVRSVTGPVGSGKSVAMCMDIWLRAKQQTPDKAKVRNFRAIVIRSTYPELKSTTIKTWLDWFPHTIMNYSSPIIGRLRTPLKDGTVVNLELIFIALDVPNDIKKLKSLEGTMAWLNESSEIPKAVLDMSIARVGRYPSMRSGGCRWSGVIMDTNAPDDDHYLYELAEGETMPEGFLFLRQPPGLIPADAEPADGIFARSREGTIYVPNPEAENYENLPDGPGYYLRMVPGSSDSWIRVFVCGEYGSVSDGRPCYPEYVDSTHTAKSLVPVAHVPLILGFDFGLTPACVIAQVDPLGRLLILKELQGINMGITQFANDVLVPTLKAQFSAFSIGGAWCDPAGSQRSQVDETTCIDELYKAGLTVIPTTTNAITTRQNAVKIFLNKLVAGKAGILLDVECKMLRKGFRGAYRFERLQVSGDERYRDLPIKNDYSHLHDALQYLCLGLTQDSAILKGPQTLDNLRRSAMAI